MALGREVTQEVNLCIITVAQKFMYRISTAKEKKKISPNFYAAFGNVEQTVLIEGSNVQDRKTNKVWLW